MLQSFLLMLGFFTRIPAGKIEYTEERYVRGIPLLPFVGAVSGALLLGVFQLSRLLPMHIVSLLVFGAYLLITGGLHLDGLGDACDALFSARDRDRMLEIMKDPRCGSFGVLGLFFAAASYLVLLRFVPWQAVLLFPVVGKCTPALASNASPYIRAQGMADVFCRHCGKGTLAFDLLITAAACFALGVPLGIAAAAALLVCTLLVLLVRRILGGITGDILGLACEVTQLTFLFVCAIFSVRGLL